MKAVITLEDMTIVARLYNAGVPAGIAIKYNVGSITKEALEGELAAMGHTVVEPWEIVAEIEGDGDEATGGK